MSHSSCVACYSMSPATKEGTISHQLERKLCDRQKARKSVFLLVRLERLELLLFFHLDKWEPENAGIQG